MNSKLCLCHFVKFLKCYTHCLKVFIVEIFLSYLCSIIIDNPFFTVYFNFRTYSKKPSNCFLFFIYLDIVNITAMKNGSAVYCSKSSKIGLISLLNSPPPIPISYLYIHLVFSNIHSELLWFAAVYATTLKWEICTFPFPHPNSGSLWRGFNLIYCYHVIKEC